jgi:hypothetical protein
VSEPSEQPIPCPRCKAVRLDVVESAAEITFFACPSCRRSYARRPGGALTDRWGSPLSLALYGVVFEPDAIPHAARIADQLSRGHDAEYVRHLAREIECELDEPTQRVSEILDMSAVKSEEHLRIFLRLVARHLRQAAGHAERSPDTR